MNITTLKESLSKILPRCSECRQWYACSLNRSMRKRGGMCPMDKKPCPDELHEYKAIIGRMMEGVLR